MANLDRTQSRIIPQHKTEAQWSDWLKETGNENFCPKPGEIIIFDPDDNYDYSRIKVGDGQHNLSELKFSSSAANGKGQNSLQVGKVGEYATEALGDYSLAAGFNNISNGENSIAMGSTNCTQGKTTVAIGSGNAAYKEESQVYGNGLKTNENKKQIIIGNYNADNPTADFIIANGTADNRKNVIEIANEDIDIKGKLTIVSKTNIGSGAEAIASDSVAIGISRCGNVKSENQSSLAIGGDVVAAGKYSIATGCETLTGVPLAEQKDFIVDLIRNQANGLSNLMTSNNDNTSWVIALTEDIDLNHTFDIFSYIPETEDYNKPSYNVTVTLATLKAGNEYYLPNLLKQPNITTDEQLAWGRLTDKEFFDLTLQDNFTLLNTNLGNNTFATGFRCAAIGQSSAAIGGWGSKALTDYSIAMGGRDCVVNAPYSAGISIGTTGLTVDEPNTVKIGNNNFNFRLNSSGTVVIGPSTLSSNLANTFLIGPDNKNYLRINSSGFTFTGNINVPDDFIENIWS